MNKWLLLPIIISWFLHQDPPTLHLAGDSTMADKTFVPNNPEKGWGQVLPLYLKEGIAVRNHALNGRSTKSFREEGHWDSLLLAVKKGDYVIVQFGHNDQSPEKGVERYSPPEQYKANLRRFVLELRERQAIPILATPISRRKFEGDSLVRTHGVYPDKVREVAGEMMVPLLELEERSRELILTFGEQRSEQLFLHYLPGEYKRFPEGKEDNTHLSPTGAFAICDLAVEELKRELPELLRYFKP